MDDKERGLRHALRRYKLNSLFVRNLLLILLLMLLPFTGLLVAINKYNRQLLQEEIGQINLNSLQRVRELADNIVNEAERMATKLTLLPEVQTFFEVPAYTRYFQAGTKSIYQSITLLTHTYEYIDSIYIYSERNDYVISNSNNARAGEFNDASWLQSYRDRTGDTPWTLYRTKYGSYPYLISLVRPGGPVGGDVSGAVIINIDAQRLGELFDGLGQTIAENLFVLGTDGRVLYNNNPELLMSAYADQPALADIDAAQEGSRVRAIDGSKLVISAVPSTRYPWTYASVLPLTHFAERTETVGRYFLVVAAITGAALLAVVLLISVRTYAPLRRILAILEDPERWLRQRGGPAGRARDELHDIGDRVAGSMQSQRATERELQERMRLLTRAQTVALQAQISPHFLSNTLDSIQWSALELTGRPNAVTDMVQALSALMRIRMQADDPLVDIGTELEHVRQYVGIMRRRCPEIEFDIGADEGLLGYQTVQLVLQPLVENAVAHGLRPRRMRGRITVRGWLREDMIRFEVSDDGAGLPPERLEALNRRLRADEGLLSAHIGLGNVSQRLRLVYGPAAGVCVRQRDGGGLVVELRFPALPVGEQVPGLERPDRPDRPEPGDASRIG
ncbi:histidine kinase [Paenibacillus sp. IB182496]|uniref:Histidine kinase n=1 Tax=Paenibacillus sabuli TaxID=2772509 RepID=A0A927BXV5_9BACL|nr:sensor histidine kinase [Paenibacillus sabuli]MBD2847419.1 histidine kinase [Paenibacillus sabuli]